MIETATRINTDPYKAKPRVLVAYASVGLGHKKAAQAAMAALENNPGHYIPSLVDVLEHSKGVLRSVYRGGYSFMVKRAPGAYEWFYRRMEKPRPQGDRYYRLYLEPWLCRGFCRLLVAKKPSCVFSTHFLATSLALAQRKRGHWRGVVWELITDYLPHGVHVLPGVDRYLTCCPQASQRLREWGVDPARIHMSGIPSLPGFTQARKPASGQETRRPRVLLVTHGVPFKLARGMARDLASRQELDLTVAGLSSERDRRHLIGELSDSLDHEKILGFVPDLFRLFARSDLLVCKAGGLIVSEALAAGLPMAIFYRYPGQEADNLSFLAANQVAQEVSSAGEVADLACDRNRLRTMREGINRFGTPSAAEDIAHEIERYLERP